MSSDLSKLKIVVQSAMVLTSIVLGLSLVLFFPVRSNQISLVQMWAILIPVISAGIGLIVRQFRLPITTRHNFKELQNFFPSSIGRSFKMFPWLVLICFATASLLLPFTPRLAMPIGAITLLLSRQLWMAKLERDKHGRWSSFQLSSLILMPVAFSLIIPYNLGLAISLVIGIYAFFSTADVRKWSNNRVSGLDI